MSSTKTHCDCCDKDYVRSYYKKHLISKKHLKNQEASGVPLPVVVPQDNSNKKHCECCDKYLSKSYYNRHLKSKRHLKKYEKHMTEQKEQENQNITEEILTFPVELLNIIFEYKNELEKYEEIITLCDGINKKLVNKFNNSSDKLYSRTISLEKPINNKLLDSILRESINDKFILEKMFYDHVEEQESKDVSEMIIQYNPFLNKNVIYYRFE